MRDIRKTTFSFTQTYNSTFLKSHTYFILHTVRLLCKFSSFFLDCRFHSLTRMHKFTSLYIHTHIIHYAYLCNTCNMIITKNPLFFFQKVGVGQVTCVRKILIHKYCMKNYFTFLYLLIDIYNLQFANWLNYFYVPAYCLTRYWFIKKYHF